MTFNHWPGFVSITGTFVKNMWKYIKNIDLSVITSCEQIIPWAAFNVILLYNLLACWSMISGFTAWSCGTFYDNKMTQLLSAVLSFQTNTSHVFTCFNSNNNNSDHLF